MPGSTDSLPLVLVLAGPIVRRVTPRSISVWVALSESSDVKLSVWDKIVSGGTSAGVLVPPDAPIYTGNRHTIRVGAKLHVAVVTIDIALPAVALSPGALYSYNVTFTGASGTSDLKSLELLLDHAPDVARKWVRVALGYQAGVLPTFVTPPATIEKLNLAHSSCRKAHGHGKDSLATLDSIIQKAVTENDPDQRPHQLFLTGDQIYADDVATVLIPAINELGSKLLGVTENLSAKNKDNAVESREASMANFPASRRQRIVEHNAGFSSGDAANHLLSFGEYAATYLMYWNSEVWPVELFAEEKDLKKEVEKPDYFVTWDMDPLTDVENALTPATEAETKEFAKTAAEARKKDRKSEATKGCLKEIKDVIAFRLQLPNVRRVLANVPVYMIMDDHEVTDDWYISKDWRDKVLTAPLGVNIIRNALMAYTLFQGWGNDPAAYAVPGPKADLLARLAHVFPAGGTGPAAAVADAIDVLFGFNLPDETPPPVRWHYSVPTSETTVYVLDTRTRRTYETRYSPPGLLSDTALDEQIPLDAQPGPCQIFVSPAPVLGLAVIEELAQPVSLIFSPYDKDPEAWALNPVTLEKFLSRLQRFTRVILLSGDIHFGLATSMDYWKKNAPAPSRFIQFVSSAAKNQVEPQEQVLTSGFLQKLLSSLYYPSARLGWSSSTGLTATNPTNKRNPPSHRIRLRREPVLLPIQGWPAGTTVSSAPDWSWRMRIDRDIRPDDSTPEARPEKIRIADISPDVDPTVGDAHAAYRKVLARHMEIFKKGVGRRVMFDTHIAIVKIARDTAGKLTAFQELWSWLPDEEVSEPPDAYVTYSVSLEPTGEAAPVIT